MFPNLRQNYDDLCEIAHPNAMSLMSFCKKDDKKDEGSAKIGIPLYEFRSGDEEKMTNQVGENCYYIRSFCIEIVNFFENKI
jgi:hypothetical protein